MGYPDNAEILAGLNGSRVLAPAIPSFPDTSHPVTPDDLLQSARGSVPNLHEIVGKE